MMRAIYKPDGTILPGSLRRGSKVAITAPASAASTSDIQKMVDSLRSLGCTVELGKSLNRRHYFLSADDKVRADDFNSFASRDDIDAIMCARGGYGTMRILPDIDFEALKKNPKVIIGFSDITSLLNAIYQETGMVTFHGPTANSTPNQFTLESFVSTLFRDNSRSHGLLQTSFQQEGVVGYNSGKAQGKLVGGNLSMLVSTLGTRFEIDTTDSILFLEEISEEPYKVDRMLTQLWLAGKFEHCNGFLLGAFRNCGGGSPKTKRGKVVHERNSTPTPLLASLKSRIISSGKPTLMGVPFGHISSKLTLPIGIRAELDPKNKSLCLLESPIAF